MTKILSIFCLFFIAFSGKAQKKNLSSNTGSEACAKYEEQLYVNSLLKNNKGTDRYLDSLSGCMSPSTDLFMILGKYFYAEKDYATAGKKFARVLNDHSASKKEQAEAYYYMGLVNYYTNRDELALENLVNALEKGYNASWTYNTMGTVLYSDGDYKEAISYYRKSFDADKTNYRALNYTGLSYKKTNNYPEALHYYQLADSMANGKNPTYKLNIIRGLRALGKTEEADNYIKKAHDLFPDDKYILSEYAFLLIRKELYKDALVSTRKLVSMLPDNAGQWFDIGYAYDEAGLKDTAFLYYNVALKYDPEYASAHHNIGIIYRYYGKFDEADARFNKALAIDSTSGRFQSKISLYIWKKDFDNALIWAQKYYNKFPETGNLNMGYILMELKRYGEAISYLKSVLVKEPLDDRALNNLGRCYAQLKQTDTALVYFERALKINPENSYIYHNRAALYYDLGKYDLACKDLQTAIEKEYNWTIDEKLETMKQTYCPAINTNRKVLIHEYKGNVKELSKSSFIELNDSALKKLVNTQVKLNVNDTLIQKSEETSTTLFENFNVFPNPGFGKFYVESVTKFKKRLTIKVFNENAALVYTGTINSSLTEIDLKNKAKGVYVVIIYDDKEILAARRFMMVN